MRGGRPSRCSTASQIVARAAGVFGQRQERLVEKRRELDLTATGERVLGTQRDVTRLLDEHELREPVRRRHRQPHDRQVARPVPETPGGVIPVDLAQLQPPVRPDSSEVLLDTRKEPAADGGGEPDAQHRRGGCRGVGDRLLGGVPDGDELARGWQ